MTQSGNRRLRRYDAKQRAEVLEAARACGVPEAQRRHGVPKGTLYKWVAQAYEEEGAERWPLYQRYETVDWPAKEGACARADAGCEPASRADEQQTACASDSEPDAVYAQGTFEQALVDAGEAAVKDDAASAAMAGAGGAPTRSPTSISDERLIKHRRLAKRYTPSQRAEALAYAVEHGVSAAAKKLGMSRPMVYAWRKQQEQARAGLGPSPTERRRRTSRRSEIARSWPSIAGSRGWDRARSRSSCDGARSRFR